MAHIASRPLPAEVCERVLEARDVRFDGMFFVGLTTSRIYCRPGCPGRRAIAQRSVFFDSAAAAALAGYRPCRRCHPDLRSSGKWIPASSQLASMAARRIMSGALNGRSVASLAADLNVSERHLRRALREEIGVSPLELAQTHRLCRARRLLVDTTLSVTRIAFAAGFQSLRRFNVVFRERYGMSPTDLRRASWPGRPRRDRVAGESPPPTGEPVELTISYRAPFAWDVLATFLKFEAVPGVEVIDGHRYTRTARIDGRTGWLTIDNVPAHSQIRVRVSTSLLPVLVPLLMCVRRLLDLDAQPIAVDTHLSAGGLGALVARRPGVRVPGAFDGFEIALLAILRGEQRRTPSVRELVTRVIDDLGEPFDSGIAGLRRCVPSAEQVALAGRSRLVGLGVPTRAADALANLAGAVATGRLSLEPGDVTATHQALMRIDGIGERLATRIVMRALCWPDAFPAWDFDLHHAAGVKNHQQLLQRAEAWRPWRAYAAMHLWMWSLENLRARLRPA